MNTQSFLPLAAALFLACAGSALLAAQSPQARQVEPATTAAVIEVPVMTVRPDAADLAFHQANRIVDLDTVTVRPDAADVAFEAPTRAEHIVDLPAVSVHVSADDVLHLAQGTAVLLRQMAAR